MLSRSSKQELLWDSVKAGGTTPGFLSKSPPQGQLREHTAFVRNQAGNMTKTEEQNSFTFLSLVVMSKRMTFRATAFTAADGKL